MAIQKEEFATLVKELLAQFKKLQNEGKLPKNVSQEKIIDAINTVAKHMMNDPNMSLEKLKGEKNENLLGMAFVAALAQKPQLVEALIKFMPVPEMQLKQNPQLNAAYKLVLASCEKELEKINDSALNQAFQKCLEKNAELELPTPSPSPTNQRDLEEEQRQAYIEALQGFKSTGGEPAFQMEGITDSAGFVESNELETQVHSILSFVANHFMGEKPKSHQELAEDELKNLQDANDTVAEQSALENDEYESPLLKKMRQGPRPPGTQK